jgi:hypothetical protein
MEQFKREKVVILPTNEVKGDFSKERIYPCLLKHSWMFDKEEKGKLIFADSNIRTPTQLQNLYIISDDEIKEGDWFLYYNKYNQIEGVAKFIKEEGENNTLVEKYSKTTGFSKFYIGILGCKKHKIIATTDTSLGNYIWKQTNKKSKSYNVQQNIETTKKVFIPLPQPSQQFIEKYIEEYNKGNVITAILVEYELCNNVGYLDSEKLKVSPDGTISIHPYEK